MTVQFSLHQFFVKGSFSTAGLNLIITVSACMM